jgi:hypothetical protein
MLASRFRLGGCLGISALALLTAASLAQAQVTAIRPEPADPLDARAPVPHATHASSLSSYRRLGDDARIGWREANEAVNRIGGWRVYAREAQLPDSAPSAPNGRPTPRVIPALTPASAPDAGAAPERGVQHKQGGGR